MKYTVRFFSLFFLITTFVFPFSSAFAYAIRPAIHSESVLAYTNAERYKRGIPMLSSNKMLSEIAHAKMLDLFNRQYFAHVSPSGEDVSDLAKKFGYEYVAIGENLALGDFSSSKDVVKAWMNSPGHRKNILSKTYSEVGIAAGRSEYKGRKTWIIVQSFGYPRSGCPVIESKLSDEIDDYKQRIDFLGKIAEIRQAQANLKTGSFSERRSRVEAYNIVVRIYNSTLDKYKKAIAVYNSEVGDYNNCVKTVTSEMKEE